MQHKAVYLLLRKFTLHVSGVNHTHSSGVFKTVTTTSGTVQLPPSNVAKWPHWREVAVQRNMTSTGGCSYNFCTFLVMGVIDTRNM